MRRKSWSPKVALGACSMPPRSHYSCGCANLQPQGCLTMAQGRITPWTSWGEWDGARRGLLSGDAGGELQALEQVLVVANTLALTLELHC